MRRLLTLAEVFITFDLLIAPADGDSGCWPSSDDLSLLQSSLAADVADIRLHPLVSKSQPLKTQQWTTATSPFKRFAAKGTQFRGNAAGGLTAFLAGLLFDSVMVLGMVVAFIILRHRYPMIYTYPATHDFASPDPFRGDAPYRWNVACDKAWFSWAKVSMSATTQEIEETCSLDAAMLLMYCQMAMELMATMGLPACMIGIPMYALLGGGFARDDRLGWLGFGNVVYNNTRATGLPLRYADIAQLPTSQYVFWAVALLVWIVVIYVQYRLSVYHQRFVVRRMEWLMRVPEHRAATVLVTGIDEEYNTDRKLHQFFSNMFGESEIKSAFVVKRIGDASLTNLPELIANYEEKDHKQKQVEHAMKQPLIQACCQMTTPRGKISCVDVMSSYDDDLQFRLAFAAIDVTREDILRVCEESKCRLTAKFEIDCGKLVDELVKSKTGKREEVLKLLNEKEKLQQDIATEQERIKRIAALMPEDDATDEERVLQTSLYSKSGFVTFNSREAAATALGTLMSEDENAWILEKPPKPDDVRYHDLEASEDGTFQLVGYAAVAGLFVAFVPTLIGVRNICLSIEKSSFINHIPGMKATIDGTLPSIGLTIMMSLPPTFLMMIIHRFFFLKANRWAQLHLQEYYFAFLMFFVLLITAIGVNLSVTGERLAESPLEALRVVANNIPFTAHFYLSYVCMQWVTHSLNLLRYMNMIKFLLFKRSYSEETARQMAEPEDQDYYGMGSRSARFTLLLVIGLVFGTIYPLMHIVVLMNFTICRVFYGYVIPFSEGKKIDLGGEHWCLQMKHTHIGLLVYIFMMTCLLTMRADDFGPAGFSAVSCLWWFVQYHKFTRSLRWDRLALTNLDDLKSLNFTSAPGGKDEQVYGHKELQWTAPKII